MNSSKNYPMNDKHDFKKHQKKIIKKMSKNNTIIHDKRKPRKQISNEVKEQIWNESRFHPQFDSDFFRQDIVGNVCIKTFYNAKKDDPGRIFSYHYEHIISHSHGGTVDIENLCLLNADINTVKGSVELFKMDFYYVYGMCKYHGMDYNTLLYKLENNLDEFNKHYDTKIIRRNGLWTIKDGYKPTPPPPEPKPDSFDLQEQIIFMMEKLSLLASLFPNNKASDDSKDNVVNDGDKETFDLLKKLCKNGFILGAKIGLAAGVLGGIYYLGKKLFGHSNEQHKGFDKKEMLSCSQLLFFLENNILIDNYIKTITMFHKLSIKNKKLLQKNTLIVKDLKKKLNNRFAIGHEILKEICNYDKKYLDDYMKFIIKEKKDNDLWASQRTLFNL